VDKPKKQILDKAKPKKHCLDDDLDNDICQLRSKHCSIQKRFGNLNMKTLENNERNMSKSFIADKSEARTGARVSLRMRMTNAGPNRSFLLCPASKRTGPTLIDSEDISQNVLIVRGKLVEERHHAKSIIVQDALL
jgi:hypothetical protein